MSKENHIWIGNFSTEKEFEQYIDQSAYLRAWKMYNDGDPEYEGEEEPDENLRCQFCKEIGIESYDEDFLYIHFEPSGNLDALLSRLPAKLENILSACSAKGVKNGNAFFCYSAEEIASDEYPEKSKGMVYLGAFSETTPTVAGAESLQGLNNHLWAGVTQKTREEFMAYFNQDISQCQFCKDVGIQKYNPDKLYVYYGSMDLAERIVENTVPDSELYQSMLDELEENNLEKINALFCYVDNGFRDAKKDEKFLIYKKDFAQYKIKKTKQFIDELDDYNDLQYIGNFTWD